MALPMERHFHILIRRKVIIEETIPCKSFFNKYFSFDTIFGRIENTCIKTEMPENPSAKDKSGRQNVCRAVEDLFIMVQAEPISKKAEIMEIII